MPYLRHRSFVLAPASPSFNTPIICSSVNRFDFMVRSHVGGLYSWAVLFAGITSHSFRLYVRHARHLAAWRQSTGTDWVAPADMGAVEATSATEGSQFPHWSHESNLTFTERSCDKTVLSSLA